MLLNKLHVALPNLNIEENKPLSPLCTLHVGGKAEFFVAPSSIEEMRILYNFALSENCDIYVLGGGSNVIFPDGIVKGIVISTENLNSFSWRTEITADIDSGFKLPLIMKELREKNLAGMEFAAGIPGTLGGAIMGNAGAGGHGGDPPRRRQGLGYAARRDVSEVRRAAGRRQPGASRGILCLAGRPGCPDN